MNLIPTVDLSQYINGNEADRDAFVKQLGNAYETVGFVKVKKHGVSQDLIDLFFNKSKEFFALDKETKKKHTLPNGAGQRGYTAFGVEHAKQSDVPDLKEFYQIGQVVTDGDDIKQYYPDNIYCEEIPEFTKAGDDLYKAFEVAGSHLLKAIAVHLGLSENYFDDKIHNGNSILRTIHYPPITKAPESAIRAEQHEDINLITLLVGASADGLELLTNEGEWIPIKAGPGEIVINVGDMLQRLTNNKLKSTTHRVVNPPKEKWHLPRLSIPFFLHPRSNMDLTCLPDCVDDENPLAYEPITAGEYLNERLREIGLIK